MLTARTEVAERVAGLLGRRRRLRRQAVRSGGARRAPSHAAAPPAIERRETLTYADLSIDTPSRTVYRGNRRIELSAREFDLLRVFAEHAEEVLTRSELLDLVWGIDRDVIPNTVETYVSFLRAKLDSGEPVKLIQTLRGAGYSLRAARTS